MTAFEPVPVAEREQASGVNSARSAGGASTAGGFSGAGAAGGVSTAPAAPAVSEATRPSESGGANAVSTAGEVSTGRPDVAGRPHPNLNLLWAHVLFDTLAANGLCHVCVTPGSRSAPLAIGAYEHPALRTWIHLDERSAAFFALGIARATGLPAALICTSGTAGANFFPAVVEASRSRIPLVVLTADRPPEAREFGTHQTIDQVGMFGVHVRAFRDVPPPHGDPESLRRLALLAADAFGAALGPVPGPVHLNLPLREPLSPAPLRPDVVARVELGYRTSWAHGKAPHVRLPALRPDPAALAELAERLRMAERPLLVAGPGAVFPGERQAVLDLARAARMPVLADIASGLRFGGEPVPELLCHAEAFLRVERFASVAPDLVVAMGLGPTSGRVSAYLARHAPEIVRLQPDPVRQDPEALAGTVICGPVGDACRQIGAALASGNGHRAARSSWLDVCRQADAAAKAVLSEPVALRPGLESPGEPAPHRPLSISSWPLEPAAVGVAIGALPSGAGLFLSNSLPVRYAEVCVPADDRDIAVWVNRGAAGIDGITSTALGAGAGSGRPLLLVTGDLAFLHDLGGLFALRHLARPAVILLLNNDGGGIFSHLPIAGHPRVCEPLCAAPHGLGGLHAARMFGMEYVLCETLADLPAIASLVRTTLGSDGHAASVLIEVRTRREEEAARYQALLSGMASAVDQALAARFPSLPFLEAPR